MDLVLLLHLDIAVEQESSVVFVVVPKGAQILETACGARWSFDEFLEVLDEVGQLLDFDVPLNDVRWIQITNGLKVLLEGLVELFLGVVELISVFFADLREDLLGEVGLDGDVLGLFVELLLEEDFYLEVVFHLCELVHCELA